MSLLGREEDRKHDISLEERRARLERKAEVIRSRLLRHVDALDARRHQVSDVANRAKDAVPAVLRVVLAGGVVLGAGIALIGWVIRARRRHLLSYRIQEALAPFRTPQRISMLAELGRKLLVSVVTVVASELAKRGARRAIDGRLPRGEHLVHGEHGAHGTFAPSQVVG